jgi:hypothetical protein
VHRPGPTTDPELSGLVRKIDHQRILGQFFNNLLDQLDVLVHSSPYQVQAPQPAGKGIVILAK